MILIIGGAFQGKYEFAKNTLGIDESRIYNSFHTKMKCWLEKGNSPKALIDDIFNSNYDVVISDEIGCGIVPMEKETRHWREETGRALCLIAEKSSQVWRVQCGIPTKIKG